MDWIGLAADPGLAGQLTQFIVLFGPLFLIWYFLVIHPQQKQRRKLEQLLTNLKTGDRILTTGGLYGTIVGFRESVVQLQIANQVRVDVARSAISALASAEGETKAESSAAREPARREAAAKGKK